MERKKDYVRRASLQDGLPNSLLEALGCEKVVTGTAVGGIVEAISDGENGKLVPTNNADAMDELLTEECLRTEFERGSRQTTLIKFTLQSELDGNLAAHNRLGLKV